MLGRRESLSLDKGECLALAELELDDDDDDDDGGGGESEEQEVWDIVGVDGGGGAMVGGGEVSRLEDGFIRGLLRTHNSSSEICRSVLNTGMFAFLCEEDIKEASLVCKLWFAEANSVNTMQQRYPIRLNRFSMDQRRWIWKCVLTGEDRYELHSEGREMIEDVRIRRVSRDLEVSFESQLGAMLNNHDEILRDISRTFPKLKEFQKHENQNKMLEILFKISFALPEVGYCQGMNYLVGIFLYALDFNVDQVFSSVMSILIKWDYQQIYNKELAKLREMCFVFNELIKEYLPEIHRNIFSRENEIEVTPELFAIQWFLTLFTYDIADTEYAANSLLILDNIVIHDPNKSLNTTVYKIALSLLCIIFKDTNLENFSLHNNVLEFVRSRSKEILMNINEIGTLLDMSRDLEVSEIILQKIYTRYKTMIELKQGDKKDNGEKKESYMGEVPRANRFRIADILRDPKPSESSSLLKRFILVNRYGDLDEYPSSFHPYFSI
ncbi:hypothetical protein OIY81_2921 [Cryptosporidium canis]|nr:hypothetical protein OIY81_2921 [Cryptosporidium canis]